MNNNNTILIWGAGAIGGTLGAYFARAGEDVLLVDIVPEHVDAVNRDGLAIEGPVEAFTQKLRAVLPQDVEGQFRRIILAVKAHHTQDAVRALKPHLAEGGSVLSAQNGLNELVIAQEIGRERTVGCFVNFGADWLGPGRILFGNRAAVAVGELDGSRSARADDYLRLLQIFDPGAVFTPNIWGYLWGKLGYGAILFATALTNESMSDNLGSQPHFPI
ncbi:MAG: 2-dehydropantoate 2-reductase N-terminal domain-containing protein, partial [Burkholderiaceae bacterium]